MNLHHFDRAINEIYEFNQTLDVSVEQLYLNRNKLDVTLNKLLDFCLHIDTEQYGYDFPAASDVRKSHLIEKRVASQDSKRESMEKHSEKSHNFKVNVQGVQDYSSLVINSHRSNVKKSQSNASHLFSNKQSKRLA